MATQPENNIQRIRSLRGFVASLRGAADRWTSKYSDKKHYDKQGFAFVIGDGCGQAFTLPKISFEAYVGTYGSSSVSNAWRVDQALVNHYFAKALNLQKQAIFDSMADFAEADAAQLIDGARAELAALQTMIEAAVAPVTEAEAA